MSLCIHWSLLVSSGLFWLLLAFSCLFWPLLASFHFPSILVSCGLLWSLFWFLLCSSGFFLLLTSSGLLSLLVQASIILSLLVSSGFFWSPIQLRTATKPKATTPHKHQTIPTSLGTKTKRWKTHRAAESHRFSELSAAEKILA